MKNNFLLYTLLILFLLGGLFYWTQIRTASIRKKCYLEVYALDKAKTKWAEGKSWRIIGREDINDIWGWDYMGDSGIERFNGCLLLNKINP